VLARLILLLAEDRTGMVHVVLGLRWSNAEKLESTVGEPR
jgi:hypothetical protein